MGNRTSNEKQFIDRKEKNIFSNTCDELIQQEKCEHCRGCAINHPSQRKRAERHGQPIQLHVYFPHFPIRLLGETLLEVVGSDSLVLSLH